MTSYVTGLENTYDHGDLPIRTDGGSRGLAFDFPFVQGRHRRVSRRADGRDRAALSGRRHGRPGCPGRLAGGDRQPRLRARHRVRARIAARSRSHQRRCSRTHGARRLPRQLQRHPAGQRRYRVRLRSPRQQHLPGQAPGPRRSRRRRAGRFPSAPATQATPSRRAMESASTTASRDAALPPPRDAHHGEPGRLPASRLFQRAAAPGRAPAGGKPYWFIEKCPTRSCERFPSKQEFTRLGAVLHELETAGRVSTSAAAALLILMLTGCHNEVLTLRWEDVDVEHDELRLREAKTGARAVPLSPTARQMLTALPRRPDNPWVIAGRGFRQATGQSERDLAGGSSRGRAR